MKNSLFLLLLLSYFSTKAQYENAYKFAETITKEDLSDHLSIIASDAMEGRETGERGQKMAAAFIADHFRRIGLEPVVPTKGGMSYYQRFDLDRSEPASTYIMVNGKKLISGEDIVYSGKKHMDKENTIGLVFAGNGTIEDLAKVNVKDKAILANCLGCGYNEWRGIMTRAENAGARLSVIVAADTPDTFQQVISTGNRYFMRTRMGLSAPDESDGTYIISAAIAEQITGTKIEKLKASAESGSLKKIKQSSFTYQSTRDSESIPTENILGYLEGSDKKEELVVITAHYDHIGKRGVNINNGADDDGSGTSAVLEIAEAFIEAKKNGNGPRRSMLFMLVTGEEKGLLGSEYYAEHPIFPLANTVVDLNIDMIGRVDPQHEENPNYIYLVGSNRLSTELHEISEQVNETFTKFDLDYTYNDENHKDRIYYRSDHWNFAKNNVPIIFYFNGTHEDYHQPTDTIDKIEFDLLTKRARLVYYTAWVLSNRDDRPVVDKLEGVQIKAK